MPTSTVYLARKVWNCYALSTLRDFILWLYVNEKKCKQRFAYNSIDTDG